MKIIIFLLLFLNSCGDKDVNNSSSHIEISSNEKTTYIVNSIESFENHYIIHLEKEKYFYKVLSKKEDAENCKEIKKGKSYEFSLASIWQNEIRLEDGRVFKSPLNVDCKSFEDIGEICLEKASNYARDLYKIENLNGLCYDNE